MEEMDGLGGAMTYGRTVNDRFPAIGKKVKVFWGSPEFVALIHELQQDTGDRLRAGFPADVMLTLHELESDQNLIWPDLARRDRNI
jgi:hypothetical protein